MKRFLQTLFILFSILALAGCASMHPVHVDLRSSKVLNPDAEYHSLPVMVRVYQLKSRDQFDSASFYQLWQQYKTALGSSLLDTSTARLRPGQSKTIKLDKADGMQYLGVVAVYRQPASNHWRVIQKFGKGVPYIPQSISLSLVGNHIYLR